MCSTDLEPKNLPRLEIRTRTRDKGLGQSLQAEYSRFKSCFCFVSNLSYIIYWRTVLLEGWQLSPGEMLQVTKMDLWHLFPERGVFFWHWENKVTHSLFFETMSNFIFPEYENNYSSYLIKCSDHQICKNGSLLPSSLDQWTHNRNLYTSFLPQWENHRTGQASDLHRKANGPNDWTS